MNAAISPIESVALPCSGRSAGQAPRYVIHVGGVACTVRARPVAPIAEMLGFEDEMEASLSDLAAEPGAGGTIVDLLDSRMIAPPRPRRRRERAVSSRAVFFGAASR
jgi:hypothetical protein